MYRSLIISAFLLQTVMSSHGQNNPDKKLTKELDEIISNNYSSVSPGCAVLVSKKGAVIYEKAFGIADLELHVPMQSGMIFRIGSMTKQYTAIAILQLVDQGKIDLQDSIQKFIKDFPNKGHTITIEHLLTHTSGIAGYDGLDFYSAAAERLEYTPRQIIDSLKGSSLTFIPGSKFHYSNSNYFILAYIIEIASGKPYKNYLQENIFDQSGLSNTFYDDPGVIIPNRCSGYTKNGSKYLNATYRSMSSIYGTGALMANIADLFKWHQELYSYKIVKKETLDRATTPFELSNGTRSQYGYGWFVTDYQGSKSIGHSGAIDGFRSMEVFFPEQDIFVTLLFNSDNDQFNSLFEDIADLLLGKRSNAVKLKISEQILDGYIGTYKNEKFHVSFKIYKENGVLYSDLSNGTGAHMKLKPRSDRKFDLAITTPTIIEFIVENGKVTRLIASQKDRNEFIKIE
jgi:CubicO group peptidase (beta-lactamase class C family)